MQGHHAMLRVALIFQLTEYEKILDSQELLRNHQSALDPTYQNWYSYIPLH